MRLGERKREKEARKGSGEEPARRAPRDYTIRPLTGPGTAGPSHEPTASQDGPAGAGIDARIASAR